MDIHEEIVLNYLTKYGSATFVCPQYLFCDDKVHGGVSTKPDFLALNLEKKIVSVVEVSNSMKSDKIREMKIKIIKNKSIWPELIHRDLKRFFGKGWKFDIDIKVFIREKMIKQFNNIDKTSNPKVHILSLEYIYEKTIAENLS